jgi:nicotinamide mononucleotide transporter
MNEKLVAIFSAMTFAEIGAVVATGTYVALAAKEHAACWVFGMVGAALWAYAAFFYFDLYIDALLQLYYVGISVYGWYAWRKEATKTEKSLIIHRLNPQKHLLIISVGLLLSYLVGYLFDTYTAAASTYLDAFTTVFSIITTALVTRKVLENWIYWVIIDITYIYLYISREGYLFAVLSFVFIIISIFGYFNWRKKMKH